MNPKVVLLAAVSYFGILMSETALADSGYWTVNGGGSWANSANWDSDIIADGEDETAYFGLSFFANVPASATFTLDVARTVGHLFFTDSGGPDNWFLKPGSGGPLTMDATFDVPSVTVDRGDQQVTINVVIAGTNGLEKLGDGTLVLTATNTYSGETRISAGVLKLNGILSDAVSVSAGTLAGTGMISGGVTIEAGGTLAPGNSISALTISDTLTLDAGSKTFMEVNASTLVRDFVRGMSAVHYGGTLVVSNLAGTPSPGQSFQLFDAAAASGNFSSITPQLTGATRWRFDPATGTISVITTNQQPRLAGIAVFGGVVTVQVMNGVPGATNYLLASTNLELPRVAWTRMATNVFDPAGEALFVTGLGTAPRRFFSVTLAP